MIAYAKVVFPLPLSPTKQNFSPSSKVKLKLVRALVLGVAGEEYSALAVRVVAAEVVVEVVAAGVAEEGVVAADVVTTEVGVFEL
jgi:hypothetical protein